MSQTLVLVGHLTGVSPLFHELESASNWFARTSSGAAEWMATEIGALPTKLTFASPFEWRRIGVPGASDGLQPVNQFRLVGWRLTRQCTPGQDPLDGLGHVQPGSARRRVQRHSAQCATVSI